MNTALAAPRVALNRAAVIQFAQRMTTAGQVTVTSPVHPDLVEHRLSIHNPEASGYTVIFITVTDGMTETTSMNFDLPEKVAARHHIHEDGLGLTLHDVVNRPLVHYRIG